MFCDFSCSRARRVLLNGATSLSKASLRSSSSLIFRPVSVTRLRRTSFSSPIREPTSDRFSTEIWLPPLPFPFAARAKSLSTTTAPPFRPKRSDSFAMTTPPQPQKRYDSPKRRNYVIISLWRWKHSQQQPVRFVASARPSLAMAVRDARARDRTVHRNIKKTPELRLPAVGVWAASGLQPFGCRDRLGGGCPFGARSVSQHQPSSHVVSADRHATA